MGNRRISRLLLLALLGVIPAIDLAVALVESRSHAGIRRDDVTGPGAAGRYSSGVCARSSSSRRC